MTPRELVAKVAACIAAERVAWTLAARGFEHPTTVNDDATDDALAALEAEVLVMESNCDRWRALAETVRDLHDDAAFVAAFPDDAPAAPDDAERALAKWGAEVIDGLFDDGLGFRTVRDEDLNDAAKVLGIVDGEFCLTLAPGIAEAVDRLLAPDEVAP